MTRRTARRSARSPATPRTVTFDVSYPDTGMDAWPWSDKLSREHAWRGIEQWLKGAKRNVPKYGVSVLIIKERGKTIAIYNAIVVPRATYRGADIRVFRDSLYRPLPWLRGTIDADEVRDDTFCERDGLIGEVPPLPEIDGRVSTRNGRPVPVTIEDVATAPVGALLVTEDEHVAWRKVAPSKSGWERQKPSASSVDGWKPRGGAAGGLREFAAIGQMLRSERMYLR
mgnify:FL=1